MRDGWDFETAGRDASFGRRWNGGLKEDTCGSWSTFGVPLVAGRWDDARPRFGREVVVVRGIDIDDTIGIGDIYTRAGL